MSEYIRINRNIVNHWLWQDAEHLKWWLDLILMAATEDREVMHDSHEIILRRGQVIASMRQLQKRWRTTFNHVFIFIHKLEKEGLITLAFNGRYTTIIEISNYDEYIEHGNHLENHSADCISDSYTTNGITKGITKEENPQKNAGMNHLENHSADCISNSYTTNGITKGITKEENQNQPRARVISYNSNNIYNYPTSLRKIGLSDLPSDAPVYPFKIKNFIDFWNSEIDSHKSAIPKIKAIGDGSRRRMQLLARVKEYGKNAVAEMVCKAVRSDFLNGKNRNGWIATLDWLIKPSNFPKVLEGNYDNKPKQLHQPSSIDYGAEEQKQREEQLRKRKATATTYEQYARWKKEHPEEYRKQQEILANGGKLSDDSS